MEYYKKENYWFSFRGTCVLVRAWLPTLVKASALSLSRPLFFLHGRFGDSEVWEPIMAQLSDRNPCFSVDFPGFGQSFCVGGHTLSLLEQAGLVIELIQKLTLPDQKAILIGHDVGGSIAELCALRLFHKISALVLMNSSCISQKLSQLSPRFRGLQARWKLKKLLSQAKTLAPQTKKSLLRSWGIGSLRMSLLKSFRALDDSWPRPYERRVWKKSIQALDLPVLLLWGKDDFLNPPERGVEMAHNLLEAYFYLNEESGHWPFLDQTGWVVSKMKNFIFKTSHADSIKSVQRSPWK